MTPDAGAQPGELSPADGSGPGGLLAYRSAQGRRVVAAMILGSSVAGIDSTVVAVALPCGMSRPTVQRSDLAGWAGYGYCASHSRFFWGLRLYLVCTPAGMPILWALADPRLGEREVLAAMLEVDADVAAAHEGILLISDKGFAGRDSGQLLAGYSITLLRPSRADEQARYGEPMLKKVRQLIESVNVLQASLACRMTLGEPVM